MAANVDIDHVSLDGHAMVDRPPWEQLDLDANDHLIDSDHKYWNTVEGPCHKDFPTAGAVPSAPSAHQTQDSGREPVHPDPSGRKPVRKDPGDVIPAMPLLVEDDWNHIYPPGWDEQPDDPYGVLHTEIISHALLKGTARKFTAEPDDALSTP